MNKLSYFQDGIISSAEDMDALAKKKSGKILVFSDTHGMDPDIIEAALDNFGQDVDVLLFCGDGFAYQSCFSFHCRYSNWAVGDRNKQIYCICKYF